MPRVENESLLFRPNPQGVSELHLNPRVFSPGALEEIITHQIEYASPNDPRALYILGEKPLMHMPPGNLLFWQRSFRKYPQEKQKFFDKLAPILGGAEEIIIQRLDPHDQFTGRAAFLGRLNSAEIKRIVSAQTGKSGRNIGCHRLNHELDMQRADVVVVEPANLNATTSGTKSKPFAEFVNRELSVFID
ncbi:hypothetical protein HYT17_01970 [Candidatus Microgenomates bacterium]|nr:hypothetical protein [Candidatus Microgenomates bacterium]